MKLSIITINYNNLEGLKKTYDSVVCQTWTDYEWIIIDGGSTDGSREFIEEHQDRFAYWCSEPDKGVYNAMNKGIAKAQGEYLNFMNSGDCFYEKDTLEKVFSKEQESDILYGDILRIYEEGECIYSFGPVVDIYTLYHQNIPHQAMFIRLDFHRNHLYDENLKLAADWKNWCVAAIEDTTFEYLPLIIARYPMDGLSSQQGELFREEERSFKNKLFSPSIRNSICEIDSYRRNRPIQRTKILIESGGFASFATRLFLKLMDILFISGK